MLTKLFEDIQVFLPKYLTPEDQKKLFEELDGFPGNQNFYLTGQFESNLLQGDGWRGFEAINFHTLEKKNVSGIVISNSCDIDITRTSENPHNNILFVPILKLSSFVERLKAKDKTDQAIQGKVAAIRKQQVSEIFYLPEGAPSRTEEGIVFLDDIHQHPLKQFVAGSSSKLFTLNQYGFYIFIIKLSIHLTRLNEGIRRFA